MAVSGGPGTAVLHSADPAVVVQVRHLAELAGVGLRVAPPEEGVPEDHAWAALTIVHDAGSPPGADRLELYAPAGDADVPAAVVLPGEAEVLLDALVGTAGSRRARTIGVVAAHGGAGATVLAAALARACVQVGAATALVDLDPAGGGLDLLLGLEHDPGQRWADVQAAQGALLPERLALALPQWHLVRVLSGDRRGGAGAPDVARGAVRALTQGHDVVLLDLPRQVLAPGPRCEWLGGCTDVVLVGRDDVRGAAAVIAAAATLTGHIRTHLVVRTRTTDMGAAEEIADWAGVELAARMRDERALPAGIEHGVTPGDQRRGHLLVTARALVDRMGLGR
ncbi:MAG: septum site-determining protein Ssd [Georgenia sp.]